MILSGIWYKSYFKEHQQECETFPVMCPNGCRQTFPREQVAFHFYNKLGSFASLCSPEFLINRYCGNFDASFFVVVVVFLFRRCDFKSIIVNNCKVVALILIDNTNCPEKIVLCTNNNCKEKMPKKGLEEHVNISCQWRLQSCVHCGVRRPAC